MHVAVSQVAIEAQLRARNNRDNTEGARKAVLAEDAGRRRESPLDACVEGFRGA